MLQCGTSKKCFDTGGGGGMGVIDWVATSLIKREIWIQLNGRTAQIKKNTKGSNLSVKISLWYNLPTRKGWNLKYLNDFPLDV